MKLWVTLHQCHPLLRGVFEMFDCVRHKSFENFSDDDGTEPTICLGLLEDPADFVRGRGPCLGLDTVLQCLQCIRGELWQLILLCEDTNSAPQSKVTRASLFSRYGAV